MTAARQSILVVDDEPTILFFFRGLLASDFEVLEASSAEEAVTVLQRRSVDLLVTDKNMPGMNGLALAAAAKALHPSLRTVLITGFASTGSAQEAITLGIVDYLVKPFTDLGELKDRVTRALSATRREEPTAARRVHVFEDEPAAAQQLCEALTSIGLTPQVFNDRMRRTAEPPEAVVVSWEFAGAPGNQAVHLARSLGVPFVVVAREVSFELAIEALRGGAIGCFAKNGREPGALTRDLEGALKQGPVSGT